MRIQELSRAARKGKLCAGYPRIMGLPQEQKELLSRISGESDTEIDGV